MNVKDFTNEQAEAYAKQFAGIGIRMWATLRILALFIGERVENGEYDEAETIALARKIAYENIRTALI